MQLEDLWGSVGDDVLERAAKRNHVTLFAEEEADDLSEENELLFEETVREKPRPGFFSKLALALGISGIPAGKSKKRPGRCNGDCANCPPHYGYRYGRWYYGHDHTHGCEFGGNKCGGGR